MNQKEILMSDLYSRLNAHMPNPLPSTLSLSTQLRATSPVDQTTINDDELNAYIRYAAAWMSKWKTKKKQIETRGFCALFTLRLTDSWTRFSLWHNYHTITIRFLFFIMPAAESTPRSSQRRVNRRSWNAAGRHERRAHAHGSVHLECYCI